MRNKPSYSATVKLIEAVSTPLGFFVLALTIVDAFLVIVLLFADLTGPEKMIGMYIGVALFLFVTVIVTVFVWCKPQHLTYDKEAHLLGQDLRGTAKVELSRPKSGKS